MSELQFIESTVARAGRRRRWQRAWQGFWQGLLAGAVMWLAVLGAYKLFPVPPEVLAWAGGLAVWVAAAGLGLGWWRRDPLLATARWVDQRQNLQERLSTALELGREPRAGQWASLLVTDAARHLANLDVRRLLPYGLPQTTRWALLVLALAAGLGFVPEYRSKDYRQKQLERQVVRDAGRQLADVTRRTLAKHQAVLESTSQAVQSVGELGERLVRNPVSRPAALNELAKMTEKVEEQRQELSKNPGIKALERAARQADGNHPANADQLQQRMADLQKALGGKPPQPDALQRLQKELQQAKQAAANMKNSGSQAADAARQSLAKALSNLSRQAQDLGATLPSLEQAIAALQAGKTDQVFKDLEMAEMDLAQLQRMAQAMQQAQQQAEQLGKDLAEQLKNGQAEAAQATLTKMAEQLKTGAVTPEQLQKIMAEVSKAVDPAAPYGKVGEYLQQALKQMGQGQKAGASQSLAKAAKELDNLMQQMADAQDLKAALAALKQAQMCVGNCQGWGQCQSPFLKPGKGGKPAKGVGTWADGANWMEPPDVTERWDNSNVPHPDMAARGQSDRGDGELPEGLVPTKVKGQLSPGGPMPSITLKGVSIKGQSTVAVQEAITAAQSQAQSALSQEQVPRAYQGAVKDYFDDLK